MVVGSPTTPQNEMFKDTIEKCRVPGASSFPRNQMNKISNKNGFPSRLAQTCDLERYKQSTDLFIFAVLLSKTIDWSTN